MYTLQFKTLFSACSILLSTYMKYCNVVIVQWKSTTVGNGGELSSTERIYISDSMTTFKFILKIYWFPILMNPHYLNT